MAVAVQPATFDSRPFSVRERHATFPKTLQLPLIYRDYPLHSWYDWSMSSTTCGYCKGPLNLPREGAKFCTSKCRVYAHRASKRAPAFPGEMTSRDRWLRRAADKRPLTVDGKAGSSTNPRTWSSFAAASASDVGVGLGFVLGDGIGCIDLDHCFEDGRLAGWAADFIHGITDPVLFAEVSQSGEGVHIFIEAQEAPGRKIRDGRNIERYTAGRYIAVTGNRLTL